MDKIISCICPSKGSTKRDDFVFSICLVFPFQPCRQTLFFSPSCMAAQGWQNWWLRGGVQRGLSRRAKEEGGRGLKESECYFHCLQPSVRREAFWEDPSSLKVFDFSKGSWERKGEIEKTCTSLPNAKSDLDVGGCLNSESLLGSLKMLELQCTGLRVYGFWVLE